jgi:peptidoglycan/LPS O-acetylase OafA/YrhL
MGESSSRTRSTIAGAARIAAEAEAAPQRSALPALTGLRFVAAMLVVFFHYQFLIPGLISSRSAGANVVHAGFVGVSLFFVLSGFILAYTYLAPGHGMRGTTDEFLHARFARIYPVYITALLYSAPLFIDVAFFHQVGVTHLRDVIKAAILTPLLLQGWTPKKAWMWDGPAWSLSAEAFFYLVFPAIGAWIARRSKRDAIGIAILASLAVLAGPVMFSLLRPGRLTQVTVSGYGPWVAFFKFSPLVHLPQFLLGVATGVIYLRSSPERSSLARRLMPVLSFVGVLGALALSDRVPYLLLADGGLAPLFAILIFSLAWGAGPIVELLSTKAAAKLGAASYALYLIHLPLGNYLSRFWFVLTRRQPTGLLAFSIFTLTAIGLSIVIYTVIEQPARRALRARNALPVAATLKRIATIGIPWRWTKRRVVY